MVEDFVGAPLAGALDLVIMAPLAGALDLVIMATLAVAPIAGNRKGCPYRNSGRYSKCIES